MLIRGIIQLIYVLFLGIEFLLFLNILIEDATPKEIKARLQNLGDSIKADNAGSIETPLSNPDALAVLADSAKPRFGSNLFGRKGLFGKIDKRILKALFKVVVDDTEYEIVARTDYVNFLQKEIERIKKAKRSYDKMASSHTPAKREYYKEEIKYQLKAQEDPEKIPEMLAEFEEAYRSRKDHIAKLYRESKQIKKLVIYLRC